MKKRATFERVYTIASFAAAAVLTFMKLIGSTGLSWWWVLAPIWVNVLIAIALVLWAKKKLGV